jgi:hypothetical protein
MEDILWTFGLFYNHLVYFMDIWYILWTFGMFYGHLVYLMDIWSILWMFGMLFQEKSGNPVDEVELPRGFLSRFKEKVIYRPNFCSTFPATN